MLDRYSVEFWLVVAAAVIIRLLASEKHTLFSAVLSVFNAVFAAVVFTVSVLDWLRLDPDTYQLPVAALLALTGQGLTKMLINYTDSPQRLLEFIKSWRGK